MSSVSTRQSRALAVVGVSVITVSAVLNFGITRLAAQPAEGNAYRLAYTIYSGLRGGWLDERYRAAAEKMRSAAHGKVDALGYVQGVCGSPRFDSSGTATEGQAFFLLMESTHERM